MATVVIKSRSTDVPGHTAKDGIVCPRPWVNVKNKLFLILSISILMASQSCETPSRTLRDSRIKSALVDRGLVEN